MTLGNKNQIHLQVGNSIGDDERGCCEDWLKTSQDLVFEHIEQA